MNVSLSCNFHVVLVTIRNGKSTRSVGGSGEFIENSRSGNKVLQVAHPAPGLARAMVINTTDGIHCRLQTYSMHRVKHIIFIHTYLTKHISFILNYLLPVLM